MLKSYTLCYFSIYLFDQLLRSILKLSCWEYTFPCFYFSYIIVFYPTVLLHYNHHTNLVDGFAVLMRSTDTPWIIWFLLWAHGKADFTNLP